MHDLNELNTTLAFKTAWWLNNPHLQTLYPALFRNRLSISRRRERLYTPDQDFLDIDFYGDGEGPLVILLHGLTGSSESAYILGLQSTLAAYGLRSAALNFRGCSGEPNLTSRFYHSGETGDIDFVYRGLRRRYPQLPMAVVGFSLGGNVLLKWLGEQAEKLDLIAACAVSVPLLLDQCATRLDHGVSKLYRKQLLHDLKRQLQLKLQYLLQNGNLLEAQKIADLGDISKLRSFWEFDEQVVARLYGFESAADYYRRSSSRQYLKRIQVSTLVIQAIDDPFMTRSVLPDAAELSSAVRMEICCGGGHVGFVGGSNPFQPHYWLDQRIPKFLLSQFA